MFCSVSRGGGMFRLGVLHIPDESVMGMKATEWKSPTLWLLQKYRKMPFIGKAAFFPPTEAPGSSRSALSVIELTELVLLTGFIRK